MDSLTFLYNNGNTIYKLDAKEIEKVQGQIKIPYELLRFYQTHGYGFIHSPCGDTNRLLDPMSLLEVNLRKGIYEYDPDLELYDEYVDKKLFLEVNEGIYLMMDIDLNNKGTNNIYYFDTLVAESLFALLIRFNNEPEFLKKI